MLNCLLKSIVVSLIVAIIPMSVATGAKQSQVAWVGKGQHRILVRIDPIDIEGRGSDEMPAELAIDVEQHISKKLNINGTLDPSSIQVMQYNLASGEPIPFEKNAYGTSPFDLPFRWYDSAIANDFPEWENMIAETGGELKDWNYYPKWGHLYGTLGDGKAGRIAWTHVQKRNRPSYYAIYFNLLSAGEDPSRPVPHGFIGDGMERREPLGDTSTGLIHSRVAIDDWNDDGLVDLVVGSARGAVIYYPNVGNRSEPKYVHSKMILMADGYPVDVGRTAAPVVVDWDGDGVKDLLVGANSNRLLFFKNVGTNKERKLVNKNFVTVSGQPLALPHEPVREVQGVWKNDYYPIPEVVDWDGDGDQDLLAGGYVTGMVYFFENTGKNPDGTPILKAQGPVRADGDVLDVGWCAAPTVADFDNDGDLDLVVGSLPKTEAGSDSSDSESFLTYFENVGKQASPSMVRRPFPKRGTFPSSSLSTPRVADFNNDGVIDLVVSARENIYLYKNTGEKTRPLFDAHDTHLPSSWGTASIVTLRTEFIDWNKDGLFDLVDRFSVRINKGKSYPGIFSEPHQILKSGEKIWHPSPMGDEYGFVRFADLNGDGQLDILFGDHPGNIYFHKNLGTMPNPRFDVTGKKLEMENGKPIKVGPQGSEPLTFQVLQGARTTLTVADFDLDGKADLVVGDTYGKVRYFKNVSVGQNLVFAEPLLIGDLKSRLCPTATDWNGDGAPDVIAAASNGLIQLFINQTRNKGDASFAAGQRMELPKVPYWPGVNVVDWNGDGDEDIIIATGYRYTTFVERSYLKHGYAQGQILNSESRKSQTTALPSRK